MTLSTARVVERSDEREGESVGSIRHPLGVWVYPLSAAVALVGVMVFPLPPILFGRTTVLWDGYVFHHVPVASTLALVCSLAGWRTMRLTRSVKRYLIWAIGLSFWILLSSIAAWNSFSLHRTRTALLWILVIVPGLSLLLRDIRIRRAFFGALAATTAVFTVTAMLRLLQGRSVFDAGTHAFLLGENRNLINSLVVFMVPLLLVRTGRRWTTVLRWGLIASTVMWVVYSEGRAGLLNLAVVLLVYLLLQPNGSRQLKMLYATLVFGLLAVVGAHIIGGQPLASTNRLLSTISGHDESSTTEERHLLDKKAWHLGVKNPAFGVGFGLFASTSDPTLRPTTEHVQTVVSGLRGDDMYAQMLAECGFPGVFFFLGLLFVVLMSVLQAGTQEARAATAAFAGLIFVMLFESLVIGPLFTLPLVLVMSTPTTDEPAVRSRTLAAEHGQSLSST